MWSSTNRLHVLRAWWLGLIECKSDFGLTWDHDQGLNEAYDRGRDLGRRLLGLD
jgi:hypothetical protein